MTDILNYVFTIVFMIQMIIKIFSLGLNTYFKDAWNSFDFVVLTSSIISIILSNVTEALSIKGAFTIIRAFRILRVFRLIKRAKSLNMIFNTFIITLPGLVNIGGLLLLLIYLYSIIGMVLFGEIMHNGVITDNLNFETFTNSFCVLWAVATGDGWSDIMNSSLRKKSLYLDCLEDPSYEDYVANGYKTVGCGAGFEGILFFFSYFLFVNLIFLNLFIAIILEGF